VDPATCLPCPDGTVGEVWLSGPSVADGYWNRSEESELVFGATLAKTEDGPFLCTGDLGFVHEGELFITGRIKDLIIIRGRNHYPQDIERTVQQCHPGLPANVNAAFSVEDGGEERLVIAQELPREARTWPREEVIASIRQAVAEHHQVTVHAVVLLRPASIPKTTSGKIQRHQCRQRFLAGTLRCWEGEAPAELER
jgi:acyl-CoA synthetase (AMP-forming)/AMP-acid ligase II